MPAFAVIKEILVSGMLRGGLGYVKGNHRAVCFSEIPLSAMPDGMQRIDGAQLRCGGRDTHAAHRKIQRTDVAMPVFQTLQGVKTRMLA